MRQIGKSAMQLEHYWHCTCLIASHHSSRPVGASTHTVLPLDLLRKTRIWQMHQTLVSGADASEHRNMTKMVPNYLRWTGIVGIAFDSVEGHV